MEWLKSDKPAKVLIADDEFDMRFLLEKALKKSGFSTRVCDSGNAAIACFAEEQPDVVLLDVQMPGIDGFATCQILREQATRRFVPIVMITGLEDIASIEKAYQCGADDFITKPINWSVLGHRILYLLKGSRALNTVRDKEIQERALFSALPDTIIRVNAQGQVLDAHFQSHTHPLYFSAEASYCKPIGAVLPEKPGQMLRHQLNVFIKVGYVNNYDIEMACPASRHGEEGKAIYESRIARSDKNEYLFVIRDITVQRNAEERVKYLAFFDGLTGLPNRTYLEQELNRVLTLSKRLQRKTAVIFANIDRFSRINESYGLAVGDALLQAVAHRIKDCLRDYDITARTGKLVLGNISRFSGDEFAIVIDELETPEVGLRIAMRITQAMAEPFHLPQITLHVSLSMGLAIAPADGESSHELIEKADAAMRTAKDKGRNRVEFYCHDISEAARTRMALESELRYAIEHQEFELYLQPKIALGQPGGFAAEALLRWNNRQFGSIPPDRFIPLAEDTGLILPISDWVIRRTAQLIREVSTRVGTKVEIAVNLSPHQFNNPKKLIDCLMHSLEAEQLGTDQMELEITEYVLLDDSNKTQEILHDLKQLGFRIAIDDFGTGYSSLNYLSKFEVDILKIDKAFIHSLDNQRSQKLAKLIISLGHGLGMKVVAEGIETPEQRDFLSQHECDYGQGYLFSRPLPVQEYIAWCLAQQNLTS